MSIFILFLCLDPAFIIYTFRHNENFVYQVKKKKKKKMKAESQETKLEYLIFRKVIPLGPIFRMFGHIFWA
jgi:hypothetical protein